MIGDDFPEVLALAQAHDDVAIERLYRELAPTVMGYLRASGAWEPEDLAGEVFVDLLRGVGGFSGDEAQFRSWVFTIAHRRLVDEFRRRGRRPEDPTADLNRVIDLRDVEHEALSRLRVTGVLDAMARLTDDQRAVLHLRVIADLPVTEVAAILGKAETAVKALQRRALIRLRRLLEEGAPVEPAGDAAGPDFPQSSP